MLVQPKSRLKRGLIGGAVGVAALAAAPSAMAAPTGVYADFQYCPLNNPAVESCLVSDTTSGTIKLGNQTVPINRRIRLQGGIVTDPDTFASTFLPANPNSRTLEAPPLDVPGGLLGITVPSQVPQPIRGFLEAAINTTNGVTAQAQLVGTPQVNLGAVAAGEPNGVVLPLRIKLNNPFLGDNCFIGSAASPVTFRLTSGTTTPPSGTAPISGSAGTTGTIAPDVFILRGLSLVDNTFSVPRASGCGGFFSGVIDPVVNLKVGLPAAPGRSFARLNGDVRLAPASSVRASSR